MLNIHKPNHKLLILAITSVCCIGVLLGFSALTYTPELSHAETTIYNPPVPRYHPNLLDITYMQDMTEEVCQNSYENDTKQLIDRRDNKTYWVTKLKDGNCWMTQNLDLDLYADGANRKLASTDSDVTSDWTSTTGVSILWTSSFWTGSGYDDNYNIVRYYDPGEFVYTTPMEQNNCGKVTQLEGCENWSKVAGLSTSKNNDEQAHYLVGNYYSWGAATAGQAATLTTDNNKIIDSTQSICPRGWTLPTRSKIETLTRELTPSATNIVNNIKLAPYYFVYGGHVYDKNLSGAGNYSDYNLSTTLSNNTAYYFSIASAGGGLLSSSFRYTGRSIRCVARGEAVVRPGVPSVNNISAAVTPTISLDIVDEVAVEKNEINPSTANLDVKVVSNQKYSVGISATNPNLTSTTNSTTIPAKSGLLNTAENGWGIKLKDNTNYTALTTSFQTFYTASGAEIKIIPFIIGISTAPDIPNGEYSTDITITATQN